MDVNQLTDLDRKIVALSSMIGAEKRQRLESFVDRSELFYASGLFQQALGDARVSLEGGERTLRACLAAARACMKLGRYNECYQYYKEGLALDPKNEAIADDLKVLQGHIISEYEKNADAAPESEYSAVSMCSQDYYPGDDELYRLETDILERKYKLRTKTDSQFQQPDLKTRKEAASIGVMAYNCRDAGQYSEAMHCCNAAIAKDNTNFRLLQLRADVLVHLGEEMRAMQDLFAIPKPYRTPEAWKLGGQILSGLDLPVTAEFWLRKATTLPKVKDVEAATLFQKVRVKRIYGPLTIDRDVAVDFKNYGRAIVATSHLAAGEDAFDDVPVVVGQLLSTSHVPGCGHCGASLISPRDFFGHNYDSLQNDLRAFVDDHWPDVSGVVCDGCERERYCGDTCRQEAWRCYHCVLCPARNAAASELYDLIDNKGCIVNEKGLKQEIWSSQYSPIILAKVWAMICAEAKRLMAAAGADQPTPEHWARAKAPFRKFISYGSSSAVKKMPAFFEMMKKVFSDVGDGVSYPINENEFEARYYQATCNLQAFSSSLTPKNVFMRNIAELEDLRALRVLKYLEENPLAASFAGMFPLHACLNHACDNNVDVMNGQVAGRPAVHVRVKRDIAPGEELFTTYIDTAMPRKLRRAWLYKSFNFWCFCRRCQFEGDDSSSCTNCKKPAEDGRKFPGCGRCKKAWYCSTKCQKEAWVKGHKVICQMKHSVVNLTVQEN